MTTIEFSPAATTAERAYFFYLERQRLGQSGTEHDDWLRAEASFQQNSNRSAHHLLPVTKIRGIGPRVAAALANHGVATIGDLATWQHADFGSRLPRLSSRARTGQWIEQAQELLETPVQ